MSQAIDLNIVQPSIQDRWKEHKRRLLELTMRDDPVLLASCIFGKRIWKKRFNVKECQINVVDLGLPLDKKSIRMSCKVNKLIRQSNDRLESVLRTIKNNTEAITKQCSPKEEFTNVDVKNHEDFQHANHLLLKDSDIKVEFNTHINPNGSKLTSFSQEASSMVFKNGNYNFDSTNRLFVVGILHATLETHLLLCLFYLSIAVS